MYTDLIHNLSWYFFFFLLSSTGDDIWNSVYLKSGSTFSQFITAEEGETSGEQETSAVQETTRNSQRRYPSLSKVTLFDGKQNHQILIGELILL